MSARFCRLNTPYITWDDPAGDAPFETCLYIGCQAAEDMGSTKTEEEVVDAIFTQGFAGLNVERVDGTQLLYYGPYSSVNPPPADAFTTTGLLANGDGRCGAWGNFFFDVLRAQGITSTVRGIKPKDMPGATVYCFVVRPTLPGQGNRFPPNTFANHAVVTYGTRIYDPSYGHAYTTLIAWEDASLETLVYIDSKGHTLSLPNTLGDEQTKFF